MNLVTDTHALIWYLSNPRRLSRKARSAFDKAEAGQWSLHVPSAVLYELVLLSERGRLHVAYPELLEQLRLRVGFRLESFTHEDADEARGLPTLVDPFDRMIVGTALRLALPLVTCDERIVRARVVDVYW